MADFKFSDSFERAIARYISGDDEDRSEKIMLELYKKQEYASMFFDFCDRYTEMKDKKFLEVGCGTGYVWLRKDSVS